MVPLSLSDAATIACQLQRDPRGVVEVAARCPCGAPAVVTTAPRLPDGTPFPTVYYVTCPKLAGAIGTLEARGLMREMEQRLGTDDALASAYRQAHRSYLDDRAALGAVQEIEGISAGGMPDRVKCLHVLVGHALARGPGVNPLGDDALALLPSWWQGSGCCTESAPCE